MATDPGIAEVEQAYFFSPSQAQAMKWHDQMSLSLTWDMAYYVSKSWACLELFLKFVPLEIEQLAYLLRTQNLARAVKSEPRLFPQKSNQSILRRFIWHQLRKVNSGIFWMNIVSI